MRHALVLTTFASFLALSSATSASAQVAPANIPTGNVLTQAPATDTPALSVVDAFFAHLGRFAASLRTDVRVGSGAPAASRRTTPDADLTHRTRARRAGVR